MSTEATKQQLFEAMLRMQDSFNQKVHPEWVTQNYAWHEAILVESAELIEHLGYKWWKHQEPDMNQVIMEMVDIWHFGMSYMIDSMNGEPVSADDLNDLVDVIEDVENNFTILDAAQIRERICDVVHNVTAADPYECYFAAESFFDAWYGMGKNLTDMYTMYVGKNALNIFRQNNGYKDGTYVKIWDGREDNEFLTDYLKEATIDENLMDNVLSYLDDVYKKFK